MAANWRIGSKEMRRARATTRKAWSRRVVLLERCAEEAGTVLGDWMGGEGWVGEDVWCGWDVHCVRWCPDLRWCATTFMRNLISRGGSGGFL